MISRRGSGGGEETHPADGRRRLLHSSLAVDLRAPAARGRSQRPLPAGLHLAPPLLRRNWMLHRRLENLLRLAHRVRLAAIFRKSIHFYSSVSKTISPKRSGGGLCWPSSRSLVTIQTPLFFFLLRSQSGIAHMSARLFCLGPKFFELFFLSHDCPN